MDFGREQESRTESSQSNDFCLLFFTIVFYNVHDHFSRIQSSMTRTTMIEPELKSDVEGIFKELGLSATEAINLFYRQVRLKKGLPFRTTYPQPVIRSVLYVN